MRLLACLFGDILQAQFRTTADKFQVEAFFSAARQKAQKEEEAVSLSSTLKPEPGSAAALPAETVRLESPRQARAAPDGTCGFSAHSPACTPKRRKGAAQLGASDAGPPTAPNTPPTPISATDEETTQVHVVSS